MGESTTVKVSTEGGSKEINGDKQVILYRLSQQDGALKEIKTAVDDLKRPKSDWKPIIGLFGIFMVALAAVVYPLRRDTDENRKEIASVREALKETMLKEMEVLRLQIKQIDRDNVWQWDNTKIRMGNIEKLMDVKMGIKPETKP